MGQLPLYNYSMGAVYPFYIRRTVSYTHLAYAQEAAVNHGKQWPGYKLVESRTNRKYTDEDAVVAAARAAGYTDIFKKSLIPTVSYTHLVDRALSQRKRKSNSDHCGEWRDSA